MNTLARVVRIREALEDGDTAFAYDLLTDLEHDLASALVRSAPSDKPPVLCPDCGLAFGFPGQLADHRDNVHWQAAA